MSSRNLGTKPKVDRPARMLIETHVKQGSPEMEEKGGEDEGVGSREWVLPTRLLIISKHLTG